MNSLIAWIQCGAWELAFLTSFQARLGQEQALRSSTRKQEPWLCSKITTRNSRKERDLDTIQLGPSQGVWGLESFSGFLGLKVTDIQKFPDLWVLLSQQLGSWGNMDRHKQDALGSLSGCKQIIGKANWEVKKEHWTLLGISWCWGWMGNPVCGDPVCKAGLLGKISPPELCLIIK